MKERIELEFQKLEKDKVTPWTFLLSGKGMKVIDFFGKQVSYQGVGFEGSPRTVFWNGFIQPFLKDIVSRSLSETRTFCQDHSIDSSLPLKETASLLKDGISVIYERMADIDQRLRGKGYPHSVRRYNPKAEIERSAAFIEERMTAESTLAPGRKKNLNTFYEAQKFWFWFIGIAIAIAGLVLRFLG